MVVVVGNGDNGNFTTIKFFLNILKNSYALTGLEQHPVGWSIILLCQGCGFNPC